MKSTLEPIAIPLPTRRSTIRLARRVAAALERGDVVWLEGPVGAGKTFFVRAACRALGVPAAVAVQSPTFTLVHEYEGQVPVVHVDLYRLSSLDEVEDLGLTDLLRGNVAFVEWGERFAPFVWADGLVVHLDVEAASRRASVRGIGPRGEALVRTLIA